MLRFVRMRTLQKFVAVQASVHNHFNAERHLYNRSNFKLSGAAALVEWRALCALRANKSETFDWLKFRLEGEGDRTHGNAFTDAAFTGYRI